MTIPFGSSAIEDCKTMARQLAKDRVISTQLSLIKTCVSLAKDGIVVDPIKFPALKKCVIEDGEPKITKTGMVRSLYAQGKSTASTAAQACRDRQNASSINRLILDKISPDQPSTSTMQNLVVDFPAALCSHRFS